MMELKEFLGFFFVCIISIASVAVVVFVPIEYLKVRSCGNHQEVTGQRTKYIILDGCFVEYEGKMVRWSTYQNMMYGKEIGNE